MTAESFSPHLAVTSFLANPSAPARVSLCPAEHPSPVLPTRRQDAAFGAHIDDDVLFTSRGPLWMVCVAAMSVCPT